MATNFDIGRLPESLIGEVVSNFGSRDLQASMCVSKKIKEIAIQRINTDASIQIKNLTQVLISNSQSAQIDLLQSIAKESAKFENTTTSIAEKEMLSIKKNLFCVMKKLKDETIDDLELQRIKLPQLMGDIFELSRIERRIDHATLIEDRLERTQLLGEIIKELLKLGNIDRVLDVTSMMLRL